MDQHFNKMTSGILAMKEALKERVDIVEGPGTKNQNRPGKIEMYFFKT